VLLASLAGEDPRLLDQEVQKLLAYVNYARAVRPEDVQAVTPESLQLNIFDMVDALGQLNSRKALDRLHDLLLKQPPQLVLSMVVRQFRLLILVREGLDGGRSPQQLAEDLRPSKSKKSWGWITEKLIRQARNFRPAALEVIYSKLGELDEAIKTGRMEAATGMDLFIEEVIETQHRVTG
jgi:DNA polymerase-3 subunit delta